MGFTETDMYPQLLIPITGFICLAVVIGMLIFFSSRARLEFQRTVRVAIERGQPLSPELLERLGPTASSGRYRDLRVGVTSISLGAALASFGWLLGEPDAARVFLAIGNIPFLVGVALVGLWKFAPRDGG
jgi:hypothetical protein